MKLSVSRKIYLNRICCSGVNHCLFMSSNQECLLANGTGSLLYSLRKLRSNSGNMSSSDLFWVNVHTNIAAFLKKILLLFIHQMIFIHFIAEIYFHIRDENLKHFAISFFNSGHYLKDE